MPGMPGENRPSDPTGSSHIPPVCMRVEAWHRLIRKCERVAELSMLCAQALRCAMSIMVMCLTSCFEPMRLQLSPICMNIEKKPSASPISAKNMGHAFDHEAAIMAVLKTWPWKSTNKEIPENQTKLHVCLHESMRCAPICRHPKNRPMQMRTRKQGYDQKLNPSSLSFALMTVPLGTCA